MTAGHAPSPLGVRPDADGYELKDAWRRFAKAHHPDRGGNADFFRAGVDEYRRLAGQRSRHCGSEVVFHHRPRGVEIPVAWCRKRWSDRRRPRRVI